MAKRKPENRNKLKKKATPLDAAKAKEILDEGVSRGRQFTTKQRKFFEDVASGRRQ